MKCDIHIWLQHSDIKWKCKDCTATFPCKNSCGHFDCAEIRPPVCARCAKKVKVEDMFLIMVAGTSQPVHLLCVNDQDVQ